MRLAEQIIPYSAFEEIAAAFGARACRSIYFWRNRKTSNHFRTRTCASLRGPFCSKKLRPWFACSRVWESSELIVTNAAGTANKDFAPGSWMMIADHINLTGTTPLLGERKVHRHERIVIPSNSEQISNCRESNRHDLHEGVYAGLLGPEDQTPAEVRMLRSLGADAIGMSTVLEVIQARALAMEVAGFSCLTNWAAGIGSRETRTR